MRLLWVANSSGGVPYSLARSRRSGGRFVRARQRGVPSSISLTRPISRLALAIVASSEAGVYESTSSDPVLWKKKRRVLHRLAEALPAREERLIKIQAGPIVVAPCLIRKRVQQCVEELFLVVPRQGKRDLVSEQVIGIPRVATDVAAFGGLIGHLVDRSAPVLLNARCDEVADPLELDGRRIDPAAEITKPVLAVPAYPRAQVLVLKTR